MVIVLPDSGRTVVPSFRFEGVDEALGYLQTAHATFERSTFRDEQ